MKEGDALQKAMNAHADCRYAEVYPGATVTGAIWAVCLWSDAHERSLKLLPKYVGELYT